MGIIDDELDELQRVVENSIPDSKLVTCLPVLIRVEIRKTEFKKIVICLTYPSSYPESHILVELKSKTLSEKLLEGLVKVTEAEAVKYSGKPHVLHVIKFVNQFIEDNPLCCCSEEIAEIRKKYCTDEDNVKLSQKTSTISLHLRKRKYFFKAKLRIPQDYPEVQFRLEDADTNFPRLLKVWFVEKTRDVARRCVDPPLKPKPNDPPFQKKPSLLQSISFLVTHFKRYAEENCEACRKRAFPEDPERVVHDENAAAHVERVYCSHLYHHDCLILYMKTPPFQGGKKCLACGLRIYHEKWKVTPELAEARWAHQQAKERELGEVVDFFGDLATS